jgi:hypothetical protein
MHHTDKDVSSSSPAATEAAGREMEVEVKEKGCRFEGAEHSD